MMVMRKRNYRKRAPVRGAMVPTIRRVVSRMFNKRAEIKHINASGSVSTSTSGSLQSLTGLGNGTSDVARIGDKVHLNWINFRFAILTADATNLVRVMLFHFLSDDTTTPVLGDCVEDTAATSATLCPARKDTVTGKKIRVVYDRTFSANTTDVAYRNHSVSRRLNQNVGYLAGGANGCGNLYLLLVSDSSAVSHPTVTYYSTVYFTDV